MISHLVLFRFRPGVTREDPRVTGLVAEMAELPQRIPVIRSWQHGFNTTPDAQAWDYGLCAGFETRDDLLAYFEHPAHLPILARWEAVSELAFVDI